MLSTVSRDRRYARLMPSKTEMKIPLIFVGYVASNTAKIISETFDFMHGCKQVLLLPNKSEC